VSAPIRPERNWVAPLVTLVLLIVLWDLVVRVFDIKPFILPTPWMVGEALVRDFGALVHHGTTTMQEVLAGFALSVLVGVPLALAIASSPLFERAAYPLLVGSQAVAKIAIAPLFVIWLGIEISSKIALAVVLVAVLIFFAVYNGIKDVNQLFVDRVRTLGGGRMVLLREVYVPSVTAWVLGSLKVAVGFAFTGACVGEFVAATRGLGYLLQFAQSTYNAALTMGLIFLIMVPLRSGLIAGFDSSGSPL